MVANPIHGLPQKPFTGVYKATPEVLALSANNTGEA